MPVGRVRRPFFGCTNRITAKGDPRSFSASVRDVVDCVLGNVRDMVWVARRLHDADRPIFELQFLFVLQVALNALDAGRQHPIGPHGPLPVKQRREFSGKIAGGDVSQVGHAWRLQPARPTACRPAPPRRVRATAPSRPPNRGGDGSAGQACTFRCRRLTDPRALPGADSRLRRRRDFRERFLRRQNLCCAAFLRAIFCSRSVAASACGL